jgi:GNAT superfamily N-acetyltransferase
VASVRRALGSDFAALVAMGEDMHHESPRFAGLSYSQERCHALLAGLSASPHGLALVAEQGGEIVGMLLGLVSKHFFSDDLTASELVVYVRPQARGGSAAVKLVRQFEAWATDLGVADITLGVSTEVHADRTAQFYQRLGYAPSGLTLVKRCA